MFNWCLFQAGVPSDSITIAEEAAAALCFCVQNPLPGLPQPLENKEISYIFVECEGRYTINCITMVVLLERQNVNDYTFLLSIIFIYDSIRF